MGCECIPFPQQRSPNPSSSSCPPGLAPGTAPALSAASRSHGQEGSVAGFALQGNYRPENAATLLPPHHGHAAAALTTLPEQRGAPRGDAAEPHGLHSPEEARLGRWPDCRRPSDIRSETFQACAGTGRPPPRWGPSLAAPMSRSVPPVCGDVHPALGWVPGGVQGGGKGVQEERRGVQGGSGEAGAEGTAPLTCATAHARPQTPTPTSGQHSPKHIHCQKETAPALVSIQPGLGAARVPMGDGTQRGPGLAAGPLGCPPRFVPAGQALGCCCSTSQILSLHLIFFFFCSTLGFLGPFPCAGR